MLFYRFLLGSLRQITRGSKAYFAWCAFLLVCIIVGIVGYSDQLQHGLIRKERTRRTQCKTGNQAGHQQAAGA